MKIKTTFGALVAGTLLIGNLALAQEHVVSREAAESRVTEAAAQRQGNLAALDAALSSPEATAAAATLKVDLGATRAGLATLSDSDLQDLAVRAAALQSDPAAGGMSQRQWLWIGLIAAAVVLVIIIA